MSQLKCFTNSSVVLLTIRCVLIESRGNTHTVLLLRLLTAKATRKSCDSGTIFRSYKLTELLYLIAHEIASQSYLE